MKNSKTNYPSPFDDCAVSRQKRMGVLTSEGKADLSLIISGFLKYLLSIN